MPEAIEGGCLCGAVRYRVRNKPVRTVLCHCIDCQRRTGSAFGIGAYFKAEDVEILKGTLKAHQINSDVSGRWLRFEHCVECGTNVTWTIELRPGARAIAVGTLDEPNAFPVDAHVFMRSAHDWFVPPPGVDAFEQAPPPPPQQK